MCAFPFLFRFARTLTLIMVLVHQCCLAAPMLGERLAILGNELWQTLGRKKT